MKTTIFSTLIIMIFLHSLLLAANPLVKKEKAVPEKAETIRTTAQEEMINLAPVTPPAATFEENDTVDSSFIMNRTMKEMAPVTPNEATFDDSSEDTATFTLLISPTTPDEATFDDVASK